MKGYFTHCHNSSKSCSMPRYDLGMALLVLAARIIFMCLNLTIVALITKSSLMFYEGLTIKAFQGNWRARAVRRVDKA